MFDKVLDTPVIFMLTVANSQTIASKLNFLLFEKYSHSLSNRTKISKISVPVFIKIIMINHNEDRDHGSHRYDIKSLRSTI